MKNDILEFTQHPKSEMFYFKVAWRFLQAGKRDAVYHAISEAKADFHGVELKKNKAAVFNHIIQRKADECGVDLGLKTKS